MSANNSVVVTDKLEDALTSCIEAFPDDKLFLVVDDKSDRFCLPVICDTPRIEKFKKIVIPSGEENKLLSSVQKIWLFLSKYGADRKSLVVNLGGGMVTDLGSFAASTFKRGVQFVNIPTTLLAQVDASVGGKTGFNFNGLKNEIGVINQPLQVIIDTRFLETLDHENFISGYAEMIKHGLIHSQDHLTELMNFDLLKPDYKLLQAMISRSVLIKNYFVSKDPYEKNIRKALNFGHTIGHAFESHSLKSDQPLLHGHAVAYGMIAELYLSRLRSGFPDGNMHYLSKWLMSVYGKFRITADDYPALYELMSHDKKNEGKRINFTLIKSVGEVEINKDCTKSQIFEALDYFRELNHE
ncbi:MAG TPA: 3-dehydroquinate synthase [Prolixibacteraceae bacterium]|nr:3-dehydroquinate synthase [Prolixibacteraceae bacterium]